jgi:hypothetical protein
MESTINSMDPLLQKAEQFGKTSLELLKLKSANKLADMLSSLITSTALFTIILISLFTFSIALAYWLGDLIGKTAYGFCLVGALYALVAVILNACIPTIKSRLYKKFFSQFTK